MSLIKSKKRVVDHGEVFTPRWLVEKILDLVKGEAGRIDSRFLEPSCGIGNFLVPVLQRKLSAVEAKYGKSSSEVSSPAPPSLDCTAPAEATSPFWHLISHEQYQRDRHSPVSPTKAPSFLEFERQHYALLALMCIYGIELLADNIAECRANLLEVFAEYLNVDESDDLYRAAFNVLSQNLVHGDALTMRTRDGHPISFAEWGYLGRGKFQRRDFRVLTGSSAFNNSCLPKLAKSEPSALKPTKSYPMMTVRELADRSTLSVAGSEP